jgi:hypothetical protein
MDAMATWQHVEPVQCSHEATHVTAAFVNATETVHGMLDGVLEGQLYRHSMSRNTCEHNLGQWT